MNYTKLENRKSLAFLIAALCLPVLLYTSRLNESPDSISIYTFITLLVFATAVRFYFIFLKDLQRGIFTLNGIHVNLAKLTHYNSQENTIILHTENSELNFKILSDQPLSEKELEKLTSIILKDIDVAFKYIKR